MKDEEFDEALSLLVDDELPPEEFARLQEHLASSEEAQNDYLEHIKTHAVLGLRLAPPAPQDQSTKIIPMERILERQKRRAIRWAFGIGAAALVVAALVSIFVMLPEPPLARIKASALADAQLTHSSPDGTEPEGADELAIGSRLKLTRGTVELSLRSGVFAIVRGPADLSIEREDKIRIDHGTAAFRVPPKARGFQVLTPEFLLTDLGTEFGVISKTTAPDEVHVFKGQVRVRNSLGAGKEVTLSASEARVAEAGGQWTITEVDPGVFLYSIPESVEVPPYLHWAFEGDGQRQLEVTGTHPGRVGLTTEKLGGGVTTSEGPVGGAIAFDGTGGSLLTDWPGISGTRPSTISLWIKIPAGGAKLDNGMIDFTLVNWGSFAKHANSEWALRVTNKMYSGSDRSVGDTTRLHLFMGSGWFNGSTELADGRWHHIAIRYNGDIDSRGLPIVDFFVDGQRELATYDSSSALKTLDIDTSSADARPLGVAVSRSGKSAPFIGEIDELYVFDGRVGSDVIDELAGPRRSTDDDPVGNE